jgi:hypothetical protein
VKPSRVMSSEMMIAAAPSAHHSPAPMPRTPTIAAPAVSQLARFILASAYSTLSCSWLASGSLARPRNTDGTALQASAAIISQPNHTGPSPSGSTIPMGGCSKRASLDAESYRMKPPSVNRARLALR